MLRFVGDQRRLLFPTDDGQLLLATIPHVEVARGWRGDHERQYLDDLRSDEVLAPLVEGGSMTSKVLGTVSERFFFRQSAGPGWALLGDAGHHKDPLVGWGISEALLQAKDLSKAIRQGTDAALERYWRHRDIDALPRFRLAEERGARGRINPAVPLAIGKAATVPGLAQTLFRETEDGVNPYELMPVGSMMRWVLGAAVRGRPGLVGDFLRMGRRASSVSREVKARRKLLDATGG